MTAILPRPSHALDERAIVRPPRPARARPSGAVGALPQLEHNVAATLNVRAQAVRAIARIAALLTVDVTAAQALRIVARDCSVTACRDAAGLTVLLPTNAAGGARVAAALVLGLALTGGYGEGDRRRDAQRILAACAFATLLPLWDALWLAPAAALPQLALGTALLGAIVLGGRLALDAVLGRLVAAESARTVLVGRAADCEEASSGSGVGASHGFTLVGRLSTDGPLGLSADDMRRALAESRADTVLLCSQLDDVAFAAVVRAAVMAECRVMATARRLDVIGVSPSVVWRGGRPLIEMRAVSLRWRQLLVKRLLDVAIAAALLVMLAPLLLLITLAIVLTSRGPAVYAQSRPGHLGRSFRCYKFRSMDSDAERRLTSDPALRAEFMRHGFKLPDGSDPRVTPLGRVLRRTSLDELPQLWNVLRGDMSLVGPRPILAEEIAQYDDDCHLLLLLKPGITGLWQVSGRSAVGYRERIGLQLEYVERWSLGRDIGIMLRTVPAVLAQRGAQ